MTHSDNIKKALELLREVAGDEFDFNTLHGNQHRQKRRQIFNALHGGDRVKGNISVSKLKHDLRRHVGCSHLYEVMGRNSEFTRLALEILS